MSKTPRITETVNEVQIEQLKAQKAELLESLQYIVNMWDLSQTIYQMDIDSIRRVIAKAKGVQ